jgi:hypothetical protein
MKKTEHYDTTRQQANSYGVTAKEREQILLDDLRGEIKRLADAVERQNELLADDGREVEQ